MIMCRAVIDKSVMSTTVVSVLMELRNEFLWSVVLATMRGFHVIYPGVCKILFM